MTGDRVSVVIGVIIAAIGTRKLEDGNLLLVSVITIFSVLVVRLGWELIKRKFQIRG